MFDSARYIVHSIDAVARTTVVAHSTSTACGPNKEGPTGSTASGRSLFVQHCISLPLRSQLLHALTWISSIEVLIKAPRAGYHAVVLRLGPSFSINQHNFSGPFHINHVCLCCHTRDLRRLALFGDRRRGVTRTRRSGNGEGGRGAGSPAYRYENLRISPPSRPP